MAIRLRALIAHSTPAELQRLVAALSDGGFAAEARRVETAGAFDAALAEGGWDVVLSGLSGASAALAAAKAADADLPFVVVSASAGAERAVELMRAGANDYLLHADLSGLAAAVEREVHAAAARRGARRDERAAARLAAVVQSSTDAILTKTADGLLTSWNPAAERLYGWTAGEAVGRHVAFLVPSDRADELAGIMARLHRGEPVEPYETVHVHRDGTRIDVSASVALVRDADGQALGVSKSARDIRGRKRVEEAVRRAEERSRLLLEAIPHMVWTARPDGSTDYLNQRTADYVGVPAEALLGWAWLDWLHADDAPRARGAWEAAVRGQAPYRSEYRVRQPGGPPRWYLSQAVPVSGPDGAVEKWVGTWTDIDDVKRAEGAVSASEARLRALHGHLQLQIERMPLAYLLSDADLLYTRWSPAAERMFGYTEAEALGRHPFDLIVPEQSLPLVEEIFARLRAGDMDAHGVCENRTKDGRTICCEWHNTPLMDEAGAFVGLLSLAQDVTARETNEAALRLRDRAIQAGTQGVVITDPSRPDNPILYASPGFERLTGYAAGDVVGRNCRFLQGKDTDPEAVARVRAAVRAGQPCAVEMLNYRRDGGPYWNHLSVSPVRDGGGRVTHFVGVQTDVTERRRLEDQYRQAQKMEAIGRLAGGIAHDFNNLLTVINGYSDLLLQSLPESDPSRGLIAEIHKAGERSAGLTRQLLVFSRKQVVAPQVLDLNGAVADAEKMLRRLIGEDVELRTVLRPPAARVRADAGQLDQVLMNLVVNARDAMPQGGRLTIETGRVDRDEAYARAHPGVRPGPYALLAVTDSGTGMTADVMARLFEPFFTTKEPGKGTGLGLAVVHGIVEQAGGHVAVSSEPGVGSTFTAYLPRVEASPSRPRLDARRAPVGTETVLLVEDDDGVRALTRHVLAGCGYAVLEAADGEEALRAARGHGGPIHLVVTDVVLPRVGGGRLVEQLLAVLPGAKVLYVSGYTADAVLRHGVLEERVSFLQKPFSPLALAFKVREVLDG